MLSNAAKGRRTPFEGEAVTRDALQQMLELLGQEQSCYTALLDLSRTQRRLIGAGLVKELPVLLAQKQRVLDRLNEVSARLRPTKLRWDLVRDSLDDNERQVLDLALATAEEILGELIASEKESEELLSAKTAA
jgi:hypothetical protein